MNSRIKNGVTIIEMPQQKRKENKKTGVLGTWISDGKYKAEIHHNGKKYHLGTYEKIEDVKRIRETAELKKEDGTFDEWYKETFPPKKNKYGVMGLSYRKDRDKYCLQIGYKGNRYSFPDFCTIEEAAAVRQEADAQISLGTFEKWYASRNTKK